MQSRAPVAGSGASGIRGELADLQQHALARQAGLDVLAHAGSGTRERAPRRRRTPTSRRCRHRSPAMRWNTGSPPYAALRLHQAALRLQQRIEARQRRLRAFRAVAGDRERDDARIDLAQTARRRCRAARARRVGSCRARRRPARPARGTFPSLRALQIEDEPALSAVVDTEAGAVRAERIAAPVSRSSRRRHRSGQDRRCVRTRDHHAEIEHLHTRERRFVDRPACVAAPASLGAARPGSWTSSARSVVIAGVPLIRERDTRHLHRAETPDVPVRRASRSPRWSRHQTIPRACAPVRTARRRPRAPRATPRAPSCAKCRLEHARRDLHAGRDECRAQVAGDLRIRQQIAEHAGHLQRPHVERFEQRAEEEPFAVGALIEAIVRRAAEGRTPDRSDAPARTASTAGPARRRAAR